MKTEDQNQIIIDKLLMKKLFNSNNKLEKKLDVHWMIKLKCHSHITNRAFIYIL